VIGAAGAIYVIGGYGGTFYRDVWASTDRGADRTRGGGLLERYSSGTYRALRGLSRGTQGYSEVHSEGALRRLERHGRGKADTWAALRGTQGVLKDSRGTVGHSRVLPELATGTPGTFKGTQGLYPICKGGTQGVLKIHS
jgi:hypothetical protein